jgi:hypothetical protein
MDYMLKDEELGPTGFHDRPLSPSFFTLPLDLAELPWLKDLPEEILSLQFDS